MLASNTHFLDFVRRNTGIGLLFDEQVLLYRRVIGLVVLVLALVDDFGAVGVVLVLERFDGINKSVAIHGGCHLVVVFFAN